MRRSAATVTVGDCPCGETVPHKKFYKDGVALHRYGFFSVDKGKETLDYLIEMGYVDPASRDRLLSELGGAGLLATDDKVTVANTANQYGFVNPATLEGVLDRLVARDGITTEMADEIRTKVGTMTDDEKIAGAVDFLRDHNLSDPGIQEKMARDVEPRLLDRIKIGVAEYQAANPPVDEFFLQLSKAGVTVIKV